MKKRIMLLCVFFVFAVSLVACGKSKSINGDKTENLIATIEDVQGYWLDEKTDLLLGFKGENYILYGFGTDISFTGTFEVEEGTVILHSDEGLSDKTFENAKVEDGMLSLENENGTTDWYKISEDEVRSMLEEAK